jgi:OmcA/MtrC family decaheme c-type cytochrome
MYISKKRNWLALTAVGLIALSLSGCGGSDGAAGPAGPAGATGATGSTGATGATGTPGTSGGSSVAVGSNALTNASAIATNATAWAALEPTVTVSSVTIASPPVVNFTVKDGFGKAVTGLGNTTKASTAPVASLPNLAFSLAKLVPGTNGGPSKWVSYIVTTVPTTTVAAAPTRPSTDNTGTLVDNGDGSYKYTFYRDITTIKDQVAAMTVTGVNNKADLGDLTYNANLTHRLTIQLSGNAPGTSTNTPTGANSGITAVAMKKPVDVIYDFIPATGKAVTATDAQRDIVANAKCEECHRKLGGIPGASAEAAAAGFHGGSRNNVQYCVVCHTEQRRYGRTEVTATTNGAVKTFTASAYVLDGRTIGDLPNYIHKIHAGPLLAHKAYDYGGVGMNDVTYPQDLRNCTKCHDGSATSTAKTLQGDNWKNAPSAKACGSCHDGINFALGTGVRMADAAKGLTTSTFAHPAGAQPDDSLCSLCHKPDVIDLSHLPVTPPNLASALHVAGGNTNTNAAWIASNTARLPPGAIKASYDIKSVSRNASKQPVMVFRMLQAGARKDLNANTAAELWDNFMGAPSVYFVFAVPQDGIAAPVDFNASASVYLKTLWKGTGTGTSAGTLTGPDVDGYYTATLTGIVVPDSAKMLTGGLGYSYNVTSTLPLTQTNLTDYPTTASPVVGQTNKTGGLMVITPNAQKVATGYTARREIVSDAKCNACHQELGTFTEDAFHAGQRNDGTTCSWCHNPNRASSGWSADSTAFVHGIHSAAMRTVPYNWHAISATEGFFDVGYPGVLNQCETCHVAGTYDFSATASAAAQDNRNFRTVANGTLAASFSNSPYISTGVNYGSAFAFNGATGVITDAAATTLVTSPTTTACLACHDSADAVSHFRINGGSVYAPRSTALNTNETCSICHGPGRVAAIKASHSK